jgi:uncharacterized protein CbrC (UPF0167 family)
MLPNFKYHPDPIATGAVHASPAICDSCGQARGFEYAASFYTAHKSELTLCPWCIASGEAARKYSGAFSDAHPLARAGLSRDVVREVCERTPGYVSWQQDNWQVHCGDACEFHGAADPAEVKALAGPSLTELLDRFGIQEDWWRRLSNTIGRQATPRSINSFVGIAMRGSTTLTSPNAKLRRPT